MLDNDGNAEFVFKGADCAPGTSTVVADIAAGTHTTYDTSFTIAAPQVTLGTTTTTTTTHKKGKKTAKQTARRNRRTPVSGAPPVTTPSMTVVASPNPIVETTGGTGSGMAPATLNIVKSDDYGGSSLPPPTGTNGYASCPDNVIYTITVTNSGSTTLDPVLVTDTFSTNLDFFSDAYTSVASPGATGNTSNNAGTFNDINDSLDLPPGSSVVYTVTAFLTGDAYEDGFFTNTATLTPPSGITLSPSSNLTATDFDYLSCGE